MLEKYKAHNRCKTNKQKKIRKRDSYIFCCCCEVDSEHIIPLRSRKSVQLHNDCLFTYDCSFFVVVGGQIAIRTQVLFLSPVTACVFTVFLLYVYRIISSVTNSPIKKLIKLN